MKRISGADASPSDDSEAVCESDFLHGMRRHTEYLAGLTSDGRACFADARLARIPRHRSLAQVHFHRAALCGCGIADGVDLKEADFSGADLANVSAEHVLNLKVHRLGAANLSYARLPEGIGLREAIQDARELAGRAEKILYTLAALCATLIVLVATTPHAQLFRLGGEIRLPMLSLGLPPSAFFGLAPWLLLIVHLYLVGTLGRFWRILRDLPAILPNNRRIWKEVASLPSFSTLATRYWYHLRKREGRRAASPGAGAAGADAWEPAADTESTIVERMLMETFVWGLAPATLAVVWLGYLPRHSFWGTANHMVALCVGVGVSCISRARAEAHLVRGLRWAGEPRPPFAPRLWLVKLRPAHDGSGGRNNQLPGVRASVVGGSVAACLLLAGIVSGLAIWSTSGMCVPGLSEPDDADNCHTLAAKLGRADLHGVGLSGQNLRRAYLADAIVTDADMEKDSLEGAYLTGASFDRANLKDARMQNVVAWETGFVGTILKEARMDGADLRGADLMRARLQGASLIGTQLLGANLGGAVLCGAHVPSDTVHEPVLSPEQRDTARGWDLRAPLDRAVWPGAAYGAEPFHAPVPTYLDEPEREQFRKWGLAEQGLRRVIWRLGYTLAVTAWPARDSLLSSLDSIDVSMARKTQREQARLRGAIESAIPRGSGRIVYDRGIQRRFERLANLIQQKALNHCVPVACVHAPPVQGSSVVQGHMAGCAPLNEADS
jgi:uncharacterized protein YjbI with pentapeptide repeats